MRKLGEWFASLSQRWLPDPMVIACLLTLLSGILATLWPQQGELASQTLPARVLAVCGLWFSGIWNAAFMQFALQMCIVLLAGYGLAKAPLASRLLDHVGGWACNERRGVALVAAVSCIGCWINWGLGLILGGVLAVRVRDSLRRRGHNCHYALIVAAAYSGMMIWHGGLSASAPLRVAEHGVQLAATAESTSEHVPAIPVNDTLFSVSNLLVTTILWIFVPLTLASMVGKHTPNEQSSLPALTDSPPKPDRTISEKTLAWRLDHARWISLSIAVILGIVLVQKVLQERAAAIGLNFVNSLFLMLGLMLHRNLKEYVSAIAEGGRAITAIVIQFPLYSGIQGIMFGSGLAAALSQGFVQLATAGAAAGHLSPNTTFPIATFLSAGLVNLFVPSGGGQWIVQGPIMCAAARQLGTPIPQTVMAVAYGDQWTNMIQPFWALPLMGLTGVNPRQFIGYCTLLMLLTLPIWIVTLVWFR